MTPVFFAAQNGRLDAIKYLVTKYKADPNRPDEVWVGNMAHGTLTCRSVLHSMVEW